MSDDKQFDFWYAVENTHIIKTPTSLLETFGNTLVNYHHIAELMDSTSQVKIREGRVEATRPQIMTPDHFGQSLLDGFGQESEKYLDWLRSNQAEVSILKYGFSIRKLDVNEHIVTDSLSNAVDRVQTQMAEKDDPLGALVIGVEEPWEVSLIKLMVELAGRSAPIHAQQLSVDPLGSHHEVEMAFQAADNNPGMMTRLSTLLEKKSLFSHYQDRFFDLVKKHR